MRLRGRRAIFTFLRARHPKNTQKQAQNTPFCTLPGAFRPRNRFRTSDHRGQRKRQKRTNALSRAGISNLIRVQIKFASFGFRVLAVFGVPQGGAHTAPSAVPRGPRGEGGDHLENPMAHANSFSDGGKPTLLARLTTRGARVDRALRVTHFRPPGRFGNAFSGWSPPLLGGHFSDPARQISTTKTQWRKLIPSRLGEKRPSSFV